MSDKSGIEWTDATWSPIRAIVKDDAAAIALAHGWKNLAMICGKMVGHVGPHCEFISEGCNHCYSCTNNHRCLPSNGTGLPFDKRSRELVEIFVDEKILTQPLRWKRGRKIFVENQSDLFGEWVSFEMIDKVFAVMALARQHTFQVLTKRADRMREYLVSRSAHGDPNNIGFHMHAMMPERFDKNGACQTGWPLDNVWLGVSVENQEYADKRIPLLLQTPAAKRFVSYEPALGPVDFRAVKIGCAWDSLTCACSVEDCGHAKLDWIICGGESGNDARPIHPEWALSVRDQCQAAGVAFFFKQWGQWGPGESVPDNKRYKTQIYFNGKWKDTADDWQDEADHGPLMYSLGKKKAGAHLDGQLYREFPV